MAESSAQPGKPAGTPRAGQFRLWAFGDAHVGTDLKRKRESLIEAIRHSEDPAYGFDWDIALNVGDNSGGQKAPDDEEGAELVRQFGALQRHPREAIYDLCGNHDRSRLDEPQAWWFRKWVDPTGENSAFSKVHADRRPYPIEGTWERYSFRVGNVLFLIMSDINEPSQKIGRGDLGGNPAGVVSGETFAWWKRMVEANPDSIIISAHHYMLKNTTTASGEWEGMLKNPDGTYRTGYHGYKPQGAPKGASYLYFVDSVPDAQTFEKYLEAHPGAIALWLGGHTHPKNPEDTAGGKPLAAQKWGVHFMNICPLTKHHGHATTPMSRLLIFEEGSRQLRVRCFLHTGDWKPIDWHEPAEVVLKLPRPFQRTAPRPQE